MHRISLTGPAGSAPDSALCVMKWSTRDFVYDYVLLSDTSSCLALRYLTYLMRCSLLCWRRSGVAQQHREHWDDIQPIEIEESALDDAGVSIFGVKSASLKSEFRLMGSYAVIVVLQCNFILAVREGVPCSMPDFDFRHMVLSLRRKSPCIWKDHSSAIKLLRKSRPIPDIRADVGLNMCAVAEIREILVWPSGFCWVNWVNFDECPLGRSRLIRCRMR